MTKNAKKEDRAARVRNFLILCAADQTGAATLSAADLAEQLRELFVSPLRPDGEEPVPPQPVDEDPSVRQCDYESFCSSCAFVSGLCADLPAVDGLITKHALRWTPEQMSVVDRALIRLAVYEGMMKKTVPLPVAISEAVELAKTYSGEDSPRFVNGVLGRIARALEAQ